MANERLISAETFHEKLEEVMHDRKKSGMPWNQLAVAHVVANDCPTVDAVEVVRCKNCKRRKEHCFGGSGIQYCELWNRYLNENGFCSYGERKDNGS